MLKKFIIVGQILAFTTQLGFASQRFISGTGTQQLCITDTTTNLMWSKSPLPGTYTWQEAQNATRKSTLCGYNDWRLPTRVEQYELQSEAGYTAPFAYLNSHGFSQVQTEFYWSSDVYQDDPATAWGFYMYSGKVYNELKTHKNFAWQVRNVK
jgi:hypothetical protein